MTQVDELFNYHSHSCKGCSGCFDRQEKEMLIDAIEALIQQKQLEARLDELQRLRDMPDSELESYGNEIEDRIAQLSTPPKKEEQSDENTAQTR